MFRITMLPAMDGDSFLIETGPPGLPHRILVDGGRAGTARAVLRPFIAALPVRAAPAIDLVVLTHVDADHIEGLLTLLSDAEAPTIGGIWFNDYRHLRMATGKPPLLTRPAQPRRGDPAAVLGVAQADTFAAAVERNGWPVNAAFGGGPIMVEPTAPLPAIALPNGSRLIVLGPVRSKLAAFEKDWRRELETMSRKPTSVLAARRRPKPTPDNIPTIAEQMDRADTGKPNGTSIAFVIEYSSRRALFLADAHPDDMADGLERYGCSTERLHFDAIKVAHHGSAANNTSRLIGRLESERWLVSSDGARHQHPDPEAIARIILAPTPDKQLIFNYRSSPNEVWADQTLRRAYAFDACYPSSVGPVTVTLE